MNVDALNSAFPKYPRTMYDKGWVYGVWYCGTSWQKATLYGQYPATFLKRALALFPDANDVLHAPSGTLKDLPSGHVTFDMHEDEARRPMFVGDCANLPFTDNSFDLVLSDPPYSVEDSKIYKCPPFPQKKFMTECRRVLRPGGHLGFLHTAYPSYRGKEWRLVGLIAVVTGFCRATRMFSVFQPIKKPSVEDLFE